MKGSGTTSRYNGKRRKLKDRILIIIVAALLIGVIFLGKLINKTDVPGTQRAVTNSTDAGPTQDTSSDGYTLFAPLSSTTVSLIDNDGESVHIWDTDYQPGLAVYFLENGLLLHTGNVGNKTFTTSNFGPQKASGSKTDNALGPNGGQSTMARSVGGAGGVVQLLDWEGNVTWEYEYSSSTYLQHHDVEMLPNGNVLIIAWEYKTEQEALDAGRDPSLFSEGALWPDSIIEVQPTGVDAGEIVWEWHVWDHLIQDFDATKDNYGVVSEHPELIDINYVMNAQSDWTHFNSIDYNAELDQIMVSVHNFSEVWIIDHSTTTEEVTGHSGGNSGCGGDLLYRWGNPQAYGGGDASDQILYGQHDAEWIEDGLSGEGHILIFNNGLGRTDGNYSSVDEIVLPVNEDGSYTLSPGSTYGPENLIWTYTAENLTDFFAQNISGAQRLPNGITLICDGPSGHLFEVTDSGDTVWEYTCTGSVFKAERYANDYPGFDNMSFDKGIN